MFRPYQQKQIFLYPPRLENLIEAGHPAHMIDDLIEALDLRIIEKRYGTMGQPAYHPSLILKIILYGYTVGMFSSRKLARACQENLAFQYLSGLEKPSFKTFIEFRNRHQEDLREVFVQTVKLAKKLGMAKLGQVALDGSKITANTSKHKAMSYGRMKEEEKRLQAEIESLLRQGEETDEREDQEFGADEDGYSLKGELARRESRLEKIRQAKAELEEREKRENPEQTIEDKKQISFADKEARCFAKKGDGTRYVYNGQVAVDMETQIIVENHIEDSVSDAGATEKMLENMKQEIGEKPEKLVMDSGYANTETWQSCSSHQVEPICPPGREQAGKEKDDAVMEQLTYDAKRDEFCCSHGTIFVLDHWNEKHTRANYRSRGIANCGCGHEKRKNYSVLYVYAAHLVKRAFQRIYEQSENRAVYRKRKTTVEPVFGQIKLGMGFQRFLYRGKRKVANEWNVVCAAFNLKKMIAWRKAKDKKRAGVGSGKAQQGSFYDHLSHLLHCIGTYVRQSCLIYPVLTAMAD